MSRETKKTSRQLILGLAILCAVALGAYAFYVTLEGKSPGDDDPTGIKPPETLSPVTHTDESGSVITLPPDSGPSPNSMKWREGVYSFLVLGADASEMRADVIMLAVFDTNAGTLNILHIPRDTYSNAPNSRPSYLKHINLALSGSGGKANFDGLIEEVSHLIGYKVSGYVFVDMKGFVNLINFIGGVQFNVPRDMHYTDPTQDLVINLKKGPQTLNGKKALELMRYRSYYDADIGRINMRTEFLKAAAEQILSKNNISRAGELVGVLLDNVKTSLSKAEMLELAEHALQLKPDSIHFDMLPGGPARDSGYWIPYKNEILAKVNERYNPFDAPITYINIVERDENRGK